MVSFKKKYPICERVWVTGFSRFNGKPSLSKCQLDGGTDSSNSMHVTRTIHLVFKLWEIHICNTHRTNFNLYLKFSHRYIQLPLCSYLRNDVTWMWWTSFSPSFWSLSSCNTNQQSLLEYYNPETLKCEIKNMLNYLSVWLLNNLNS